MKKLHFTFDDGREMVEEWEVKKGTLACTIEPDRHHAPCPRTWPAPHGRRPAVPPHICHVLNMSACLQCWSKRGGDHHQALLQPIFPPFAQTNGIPMRAISLALVLPQLESGGSQRRWVDLRSGSMRWARSGWPHPRPRTAWASWCLPPTR